MQGFRTETLGSYAKAGFRVVVIRGEYGVDLRPHKVLIWLNNTSILAVD